MKLRGILFSAAAATLTSLASASPVVTNFDTITTGATVDSYYAGGTDSYGEVGPNWGITYLAGDWATTTGFGETSQPNLAYSISGAGTVDDTNGFSGSLSFTYGAFTDATVSIYSGLDGTGAQLTSVLVPSDDPSAFSPYSISFAGTAESVVISAGAAQFGWDDVTYGSVPDGGSYTMILFALSSGCMAVRRRFSRK